MPATSPASRTPGGNRRLAAAQACGDRGAQELHLAGEVLRGSLREPGGPHQPDQLARARGRRQQRIVRADHEPGVRAPRAEQQRPLGVLSRRHVAQRGARQHVHLAGAVPADHVAPRGARRDPPHDAQQRAREQQLDRRVVQDHRDPGGHARQQLLEVRAVLLEVLQHGERIIGLRRLVPGGE